MRAFRLCRSSYPAYDGEGACRVGGRWNSKGVRVLYMSENRSLAVLEVLVHLSGTLPDKYFSRRSRHSGGRGHRENC
jgi:RES domain-containing protein